MIKKSIFEEDVVLSFDLTLDYPEYQLALTLNFCV
jgi:hypothetical protein